MAALALAVSSCGGDDANDDSSPAAAGTSAAEQTEQPRSESQAGSQERSPSKKTTNGSGGASAPADPQGTGEDSTEAQSKDQGGGKSKPKSAPKTPQEYLAELSPAQRRHLHRDLYNQGKNACYVFGAEELARSFNLPATDPAELARQFAVAYEKATPSLILPYQQGCLAGLRKHERNPPKDED